MDYIELKNIEKCFGGQRVLKNINLSLQKGEFASLLGPSGCGKSTLLRCLAGLETVTSGQIVIDGAEVTGKSPKEREVGMVFQQYSLFPNMTVEQNVGFGLKMKHIPKPGIQDEVTEILETVALTGSEKKKPSQLSGGMQQRVALARALVTKPKVLLLDEPLSAIDAKLRKTLQTEIKRIQRETSITTVFVTHDQSEAMVMSDSIHIMHAGEIEQSGKPSEIYIRPKTRFAAGFIGNYNLLTSDEFFRLTGVKDSSDSVAIRPESISIGRKDEYGREGQFVVSGEISDFTLHGNIISYKISSSGVVLNADVLYRSFNLYNTGETVYMAFEKHNCIPV